MKELEERILKDGELVSDDILKVGSFYNQQIDSVLIHKMAVEWKKLFEGTRVDKILTIEASGIAMAIMLAYEFGVPLVFAKKKKTSNINSEVYTTQVTSFTHGRVYDILVDRKYLNAGENILITDDFLATGAALIGLKELCDQAGANVVGCCIGIEKAFQGGGDAIRKQGIRVESLARIKSMDMAKGIEFC